MKEYIPVLKNKNYVYLLMSQLFSQLTINVMNFLLLVKVFEDTNSSIATSLLWIAYALPSIIIGPFAATSVDMINRKKILMVTNLLQSLTIFAYAFYFGKNIFILYGVAMIYAFLNQFYLPAESASLPSIVEKKLLAYANGIFFLSQQAMVLMGFGIAGYINQIFGFKNSVLICSILLFIAFISVSMLPPLKVKDKIPNKFDEAFIKFFQRIFDGYRYISQNNLIKLPFLILFLYYIFTTVIIINVPVIAKEIFGIAPKLMGLFIVTPTGIGAVIGALLIPNIINKNIRKKKIIEFSLLMVIAMFIILIFATPWLNHVPRIIISSLAVGFIGLSSVGIIIPTQTFLQTQVEHEFRGRIFGNFWFVTTAVSVIPVLFSGTIAELFGIRLILTFGIVLLFIVTVMSKKFGDTALNS